MDSLAKFGATQFANYIVFDNSSSLVESLLAFNSIELFYFVFLINRASIL